MSLNIGQLYAWLKKDQVPRLWCSAQRSVEICRSSVNTNSTNHPHWANKFESNFFDAKFLQVCNPKEPSDPSKIHNLDKRTTFVKGGFKLDKDGYPINPYTMGDLPVFVRDIVTCLCKNLEVPYNQIRGRGILPSWGPNQVLILEIHIDSSNSKVLHIKSSATGKWSLPQIYLKGTTEETIGTFLEKIGVKVNKQAQQRFEIIRQGYLDDSQNTTNAWKESADIIISLTEEDAKDLLAEAGNSDHIRFFPVGTYA